MVRQGISAELIAARWQITRNEMDEFALQSHQRAVAAEDAGLTRSSIASVDIPAADGGTRHVEKDEGPRRDTSLERLALLKPAFEDEAAAERFQA